MTDYIDSLQQTGDFLTITRNHEWHLAPCRFTLENQTTVEVWDTGVICFEPANAGDKDIVLSSAVHGNETAPIEICDDLIAKVIKQEIELKHRVLFLFGNPAAMNIAKRFVEENLNRLFSGAHSHGPGLVNKERERAKKLEHYVARFFTSVAPGRYRCHYDLHTAIRGSKNEKFAIYPYLHGGKWRKDQFQLLAACGVKTFLLMGSSATTFAYFSSNSFNADAFTVELGKVRPFGENDMTRFAAAADTLERLICGRDLNLPEFNAEEMEFFDVYRIVNRYTDDFELNFPDDELNFTDFPIGYVLARDGDKEHVVDKEGEAIVFPLANVAKGQRALITVVPMDVSDNLI